MTGKRQQYLIAVLVLAGTTGVWGACSWRDRGLAEQRENAPHKAVTSSPTLKPVESIAEMKQKGFDGVDFSYDA